MVEAKRCVDDATAKLQIEADRAAQAEKLLSRKTDEGRAFQVVKYNLETSLAQAQEKIALGERHIKKLTDGPSYTLCDRADAIRRGRLRRVSVR